MAGTTRVLITGMSGTGKSTTIAALAARGYKAIDTDSDEWSEWVTIPGDAADGQPAERDWVWREDRLRDLLATDDVPALFVAGCKSNQGQFYPRFDRIVLLSAPVAVIEARLATRTNNPYGKHPDEFAQVLRYLATVEPLLRRRATLEIDTSAPLARVVETILRHSLP